MTDHLYIPRRCHSEPRQALKRIWDDRRTGKKVNQMELNAIVWREITVVESRWLDAEMRILIISPSSNSFCDWHYLRIFVYVCSLSLISFSELELLLVLITQPLVNLVQSIQVVFRKRYPNSRIVPSGSRTYIVNALSNAATRVEVETRSVAKSQPKHCWVLSTCLSSRFPFSVPLWFV